MSKVKIITVVCWMISALAILGLAAWFIFSGVLDIGRGGIFFFSVGNFEAVHESRIPADGINSLDIDWTSGRISIRTHGGNYIQVTEFAPRELRENEQHHQIISGSTLSIEFMQGRNMRNMPSKNLEILVPRENFASVNIRSISGRIDIFGLYANMLDLRSTSGRVEIFNSDVNVVNLHSTSGRIEISGTNADVMNLRSVSGRVELLNTQVRNLGIESTSGRQYLTGSFDILNLRSVSGRIEIDSNTIPQNLVAHATTGRISVTVPNTAEPIAVFHSSSSGRFTSNIPVITGAVEPQFRLTTTSGRIEINAR